jgi:hypothetical protein
MNKNCDIEIDDFTEPDGQFEDFSFSLWMWKDYDKLPYYPDYIHFKLIESPTAILLMSNLEKLNSKFFGKEFTIFAVPSAKASSEELILTNWLSISSQQLEAAFSEFGIRYKSKEDAMRAKDLFDGNYYAWIDHESMDGRAHFYRNDELVLREYKSLMEKLRGRREMYA